MDTFLAKKSGEDKRNGVLLLGYIETKATEYAFERKGEKNERVVFLSTYIFMIKGDTFKRFSMS